MAVIADSNVLIDFLTGRPADAVVRSIAAGTFVLSPLVVAEILSGDNTPAQRVSLGELLQEYPLHATSLRHWIDVGALRRGMRVNGINVTIPDAHVAQCALDRNALLLTRDDVFTRIARYTRLRVDGLR